MANSSFASWNILEFFFLNSFDPWLVESADAEPADMKGRLYTISCNCITNVLVITTWSFSHHADLLCGSSSRGWAVICFTFRLLLPLKLIPVAEDEAWGLFIVWYNFLRMNSQAF